MFHKSNKNLQSAYNQNNYLHSHSITHLPIRSKNTRMKLFRICASFILPLLFAFTVQAQKNFLKEAEVAFNNEQYFTAKDLYKEASLREKKPEKKVYCLFKVGECYRLLLDPEQAEQYYERAIQGNYKDPIVYLRIADMQREEGKYKEAEKNYTTYFQKSGDQLGQDRAESCRLAQEWIKNKTRHIIQAEVILNTEFFDFSPMFADRKNTEFIFSSSRTGSGGTEIDPRTGEGRTDLWTSTRDKKGNWGQPTPLPAPVNTEDNEGAATFDRKGETMYFTLCPNEKKQNLGCEIMMVEHKSGKWGTPEKMKLKDHDSITVGHPTLTNDDQALIFASDMGGGQGGKDLWMVVYDKREKTWGMPINLGPKINTPGDEMFPYIHDDGSLYYSSDGLPGMGGLDIFKASPVGTEKKWENPTNLMYPLNSPQHDFGIIFEGKDRGYFTSNRVGGKGRDDIYSFMLPPLLYELNVTVLDEKGKPLGQQIPIPGIEIRLVGSDNSSVTLKTDDKGYINFVTVGDKRYINENTTYTVEAVVPAKLMKAGELKKQFSTVGKETSTIFSYTFYMKQIPINRPIDMPELRYPYDKWDLLVDETINSKDSLLYLYQLMVENPTFIIQLRSHTDTRGSAKYNRELAQKRAKTCVDFLVAMGINPARLIPKGMGEDEPRVTDAEIAKMKTKPEQEAAHQYNRRTDFKIISADYKPTEQDLLLKPLDYPWLKKRLHPDE
jgi:peptidoglycan-associated lipoprotein